MAERPALFQRLSILIQCYISILLRDSFVKEGASPAWFIVEHILETQADPVTPAFQFRYRMFIISVH